MSLIETAAAPAKSGPMDLGVVPSELDGGVAARAAIGLVVLATDQTMEHEFRILVRQPGVAFYSPVSSTTMTSLPKRCAP